LGDLQRNYRTKPCADQIVARLASQKGPASPFLIWKAAIQVFEFRSAAPVTGAAKSGTFTTSRCCLYCNGEVFCVLKGYPSHPAIGCGRQAFPLKTRYGGVSRE